MNLPRILVVSGPTASGKSSFAVDLAEKLNAEIVSADSVAVYRGFDIGAAKPPLEDLTRIRHHLISELEATDDFSAGRFRELAQERIREIHSRGKQAIVVGGTGLYIRALLCGLISDATERLELADVSQAEAHAELRQLDPETTIHPEDTARTRRALEFAKRTGRTISEARREHGNQERSFAAMIFLLEPPREVLYERIDDRVKKMLEAGLVEETKRLLQQYPETAKPFSAIGYRHAVQYLRGELESIEPTLSRDTRRFAKRQFTWWRNEPVKLEWRDFSKTECPFDSARSFLERSEDFKQDATFVTRPIVGRTEKLSAGVTI